MHLDFVMAAANLKAEIYGIPQVRDQEAVKGMLKKVSVPEFKPRSGVKISVTDAELESSANNGNYGNSSVKQSRAWKEFRAILTITENQRYSCKTYIPKKNWPSPLWKVIDQDQ